MSTVIYTVTSRNTIFNGESDIEDMRKDPLCWYESDNRKESLEVARKHSDVDTIHVWKAGVARNVYQWSALEIENDDVIDCEVKIFDSLDRFKRIKKIAKRAHLFNVEMAKFTRQYNYDLISYIVGKRELIGNGVCERNDHWIDLYRYETLAFGDFTAYEDNGHLWLPDNFTDYGIMSPDELLLAMNEGDTFWQDSTTDNPDDRLLYKTFQNY